VEPPPYSVRALEELEPDRHEYDGADDDRERDTPDRVDRDRQDATAEWSDARPAHRRKRHLTRPNRLRRSRCGRRTAPPLTRRVRGRVEDLRSAGSTEFDAGREPWRGRELGDRDELDYRSGWVGASKPPLTSGLAT
jgi:hypothetical protein